MLTFELPFNRNMAAIIFRSSAGRAKCPYQAHST